MEIIFKGRQTDLPARFRKYATDKLNKLEKLDQKAIRIDVEVSVERNPRQASQKERVELTISSRGPAIRAEAAAEDRFAALDLALAKLDSRLRRAHDRRKDHYGGHGVVRLVDLPDGEALPGSEARPGGQQPVTTPTTSDDNLADDVVPIEMEGDGPLVVRQKIHQSRPMAIDQALLEMELVGHDFYLFQDIDCDTPSVVYRRQGYQYGVIRLQDNSVNQQDPHSAAIKSDLEAGAERRPDALGNGQPGPGVGLKTPTALRSS
jgi:ribosomal subunit interface protein